MFTTPPSNPKIPSYQGESAIGDLENSISSGKGGIENILDLDDKVNEIEKLIASGVKISNIYRDNDYPKSHDGEVKVRFNLGKDAYEIIFKSQIHCKYGENGEIERQENSATLLFDNDSACEIDNTSSILTELDKQYGSKLVVYVANKDVDLLQTTVKKNLL